MSAIPNAIVGSSFKFYIRNTADGAEDITLTAPNGTVTLDAANDNTIAQNNTKCFLVVCTNVTATTEAVTIYSLGTSVH